MLKITPFLWFDKQAEEAARFYVTLFPNSRILSVNRVNDDLPDQAATVVEFELNGFKIMAMGARSNFRPTEAFSFYVDCDTQEEVDRLWNALTSGGGEESMCGWLKDRYGVSWQIIPKMLTRVLGDPDRKKTQNVMQAMFQMRKLDIATLQRAYDQA